MAPLSFAERVVRLEQQMQSLQELPKRIDDLTLQVSQLRVEMRGEFSEIRSAMAAEFTNVRDEMVAEFGNVRAEMAEGFAAPTGALARAVEGLHAEIRTGDEETRRQMRVLHEDLVGRIALIQEGLGGAKRKSAKPRRPR